MTRDEDRFYAALLGRDRRFDGRFFVGVVTTGVYCRPVCPARTPLRKNVRFFSCAAAAESAGFRACRRCRPESAPGTPAWLGSSALVARGLRLIRAGGLDDADVETLAARLGVGARQLRRLFARHLGASPAEIARARRVHFARELLDSSDRAITDVAFAAGFRSVRRFNEAFRRSFGAAPRELRRSRKPAAGDGLELRLRYRPPYDWDGIARFLAARAIPGVEHASERSYRRTVCVGGAPGWIEVAPLAGESALGLRVSLPEGADLLGVAERVRGMFDLSSDPLAIGDALGACPELGPIFAAAPGLRLPGAWDPFELGVRAILGQQVSVRAATTLAGRIARAFGKPQPDIGPGGRCPAGAGPGLTHLFPPPEALAHAELEPLGLVRTRAEAIRGFARAVASGALALDGARGLDDAVEKLVALPGVGAWTAQYVALRALGEPDAFPAADLGLRKALGNGAPLATAAAAARAEAWRPWRSYAAIALWRTLEEGRAASAAVRGAAPQASAASAQRAAGERSQPVSDGSRIR